MRKESRDDAIARADREASLALVNQVALSHVMRRDEIKWFRNKFWKIGVCPERPSGERAVIVFEVESGRVYPDGRHDGMWRAEWLSKLQAWRRDVYRHLAGTVQAPDALADLLGQVEVWRTNQAISEVNG